MQPSTNSPSKKAGLAHWAKRVLEECDNASQDFAADPVHDLRVAIRRCRSMADGFLSVDPDLGWKQMKRSVKPLFSALGDLRDAQIMEEWVTRLSPEPDPVRLLLVQVLRDKQTTLKGAAQEALHSFDRKMWMSQTAKLAKRTDRVPVEGLVFQHLALERWMDGRELHRRALRNRSQVGYHQLRIGIKRFRYTLENFLPQRHEVWGRDLRGLQDVLGDVHDLDVLRGLIKLHAELPVGDRLRWQTRIAEERQGRLNLYRQKMLGRDSLWLKWRAGLPSGSSLQQAAMEKLHTWACFVDPEPAHAEHVTDLALQIYDGLSQAGSLPLSPEYRSILQAAALLHEAGRHKGERGHRNRGYRMIRKLKPPLGWSSEQLHSAAAVARLHRGALPQKGDSSFVGLGTEQRRSLLILGGILRLANACDWDHKGTVSRISLELRDRAVALNAEGLQPLGALAERIARARYLLETLLGMPILIAPVVAKPATAAQPRRREQVRAAGTA